VNLNDMNRFKLALIDIDGTLCRGTEAIPGAAAFVERLRKRKIQPVFFTNNATRTPDEVMQMLKTAGIQGSADEVCTAALATAEYVRNACGEGAHVYYIGVSGLEIALQKARLVPVSVHQELSPEMIKKVKAAVIGLDTDIHYRDLARFCQVVFSLQSFILTNPDIRLPVPGGFLPGNGALGAFVQKVTDVSPVVIGKPEPSFIEFALSRYQGTLDETFVVGDNLLTDIAVANRAGVYSVHVQTGVSVTRPEAGDGVGNVTDEIRLPVANETHTSLDPLFLNE
jgi:4-nitrophenyl phosphatase